MMLEMADDDPSEKMTPMKIETPLNASVFGPGNVGKRDDQREGHDHHAHDLVGRLRPLGIESMERHASLTDRVEEQADHPQCDANEDEQDQEERQARDVLHEPEDDHAPRRQREPHHVLRYSA